MAEDLENDKWVKAYFTLSSSSSGIIGAKKELSHYAEEMGWVVEVDKKGFVDEDGYRFFRVEVVPKSKKCSPEELREKRDLIEGFALSIARDLIYIDREIPEDVFSISWLPYKAEDKKDRINIDYGGVFIIDVELNKIIKMEIENPNLSKKSFGISLQKWYKDQIHEVNKTFAGKDSKARAQSIMKLLEDNGMPKIEPKKKSFLQKILD